MQVKGALLHGGCRLEVVFLRSCSLYPHSGTCYSTRRVSIVSQKGSQGALDH